jgi:hypothetical protein
MGWVKDSDICEVTKLPEGTDDGGLEGDADIEEDDWDALYDYESPVVVE